MEAYVEWFNGMFHSIAYKNYPGQHLIITSVFRVSWLKDVTGNFVYFNIHLSMPLLVLSEIVYWYDWLLYERAVIIITNNTERTTNSKLMHWIGFHVENIILNDIPTSATAHQTI